MNLFVPHCARFTSNPGILRFTIPTRQQRRGHVRFFPHVVFILHLCTHPTLNVTTPIESVDSLQLTCYCRTGQSSMLISLAKTFPLQKDHRLGRFRFCAAFASEPIPRRARRSQVGSRLIAPLTIRCWRSTEARSMSTWEAPESRSDSLGRNHRGVGTTP